MIPPQMRVSGFAASCAERLRLSVSESQNNYRVDEAQPRQREKLIQSRSESLRLSAHQAAEPQNYFGLLAILSSIFGRLAITASPTIFRLFPYSSSSVSSFLCHYS